ncbi:hypothetical protein ACG7TL_002518 [Trametes sanguinea]
MRSHGVDFGDVRGRMEFPSCNIRTSLGSCRALSSPLGKSPGAFSTPLVPGASRALPPPALTPAARPRAPRARLVLVPSRASLASLRPPPRAWVFALVPLRARPTLALPRRAHGPPLLSSFLHVRCPPRVSPRLARVAPRLAHVTPRLARVAPVSRVSSPLVRTSQRAHGPALLGSFPSAPARSPLACAPPPLARPAPSRAWRQLSCARPPSQHAQPAPSCSAPRAPPC